MIQGFGPLLCLEYQHHPRQRMLARIYWLAEGGDPSDLVPYTHVTITARGCQVQVFLLQKRDHLRSPSALCKDALPGSSPKPR